MHRGEEERGQEERGGGEEKRGGGFESPRAGPWADPICWGWLPGNSVASLGLIFPPNLATLPAAGVARLAWKSGPIWQPCLGSWIPGAAPPPRPLIGG